MILAMIVAFGCKTKSYQKAGTEELFYRLQWIDEYHSEQWHSTSISAYKITEDGSFIVATEDLLPRTGDIQSTLYIKNPHREMIKKSILLPNISITDVEISSSKIYTLQNDVKSANQTLVVLNDSLQVIESIDLDNTLNYKFAKTEQNLHLISSDEKSVVVKYIGSINESKSTMTIGFEGSRFFVVGDYLHLYNPQSSILKRYSLLSDSDKYSLFTLEINDLENVVYSDYECLVYRNKSLDLYSVNTEIMDTKKLSSYSLPFALKNNSKIYSLSYLNPKELSGVKLNIFEMQSKQTDTVPLLHGLEYRVDSIFLENDTTFVMQGTRLKRQYKRRRRSLGYFMALGLEPIQN